MDFCHKNSLKYGISEKGYHELIMILAQMLPTAHRNSLPGIHILQGTTRFPHSMQLIVSGARALLQYACKLNLYRTPSGRGVQRHLRELIETLIRDYDEARRSAGLPSLRPADEEIE
jgi:hypothetical protein